MLEHHKEAIRQALAGNFIPLNLIEQKIAESVGLYPRRAGQSENEARCEFVGYKIVDQVFTPTGRMRGYNWARHCKACRGTGVLYADGSGGKCHPLNCPECGGDGREESDVETDYNGVVVAQY